MARRKAPVMANEQLDQLLAGDDPQSALRKDGLVDELKWALDLAGAECGDGPPSGRWGSRGPQEHSQRLWQ